MIEFAFLSNRLTNELNAICLGYLKLLTWMRIYPNVAFSIRKVWSNLSPLSSN